MVEQETILSLGRTLNNQNASLSSRFRALFALKEYGRLGENSAIDEISKSLADTSVLLKHEVAYVLGQTGNKQAIEYLRRALADKTENEIVRHEAAEALGALDDDGSVDLLQSNLSDTNDIVRESCELALARIDWVKNEKNTEVLANNIYTSVDPAPSAVAMNSSAEQEVIVLKDILCNDTISLFLRYRAMFRLRDIGTVQAVEALACGFQCSSILFRHEIAYVFGQMCSPHSVEALSKVSKNNSEHAMVRHEAVEALGSIAEVDLVSFLTELSADAEVIVRESAIVALDMLEYNKSEEFEYAK